MVVVVVVVVDVAVCLLFSVLVSYSLPNKIKQYVL